LPRIFAENVKSLPHIFTVYSIFILIEHCSGSIFTEKAVTLPRIFTENVKSLPHIFTEMKKQ